MSFKVDPKTEFRLRKFQQKLQKERKEAVGFNEVLKTLLDQVEEAQRKSKPVRVMDRKRNGKKVEREVKSKKSAKKAKVSRYIPAAIKREVDQKHQGKCGYPSCNKPHQIYHHPERFALTKNHQNLVPLCHEHHQITHAGLVKNEDRGANEWRLRKKPDRISLAVMVDQRVWQAVKTKK